MFTLYRVTFMAPRKVIRNGFFLLFRGGRTQQKYNALSPIFLKQAQHRHQTTYDNKLYILHALGWVHQHAKIAGVMRPATRKTITWLDNTPGQVERRERH